MIHPIFLEHFSIDEQAHIQRLFDEGVDIDNIGGQFPLQAEGNVNGVEFYYRARHGRWALSIGENPVAISCGHKPGFTHDGEYDETHLLEAAEALRHIEEAVAKYREQGANNVP